IRAEALYETHVWDQSLKSFDRLLELQADNLDALRGKAKCLYHLERLNESFTIWNIIIDRLTQNYKHGSFADGVEIAAAFANRSGVLQEQGNLPGADTDAKAALDMYRWLITQNAEPSIISDAIQTLLHSASIHADTGQYAEALADYKQANELCDSIAKVKNS